MNLANTVLDAVQTEAIGRLMYQLSLTIDENAANCKPCQNSFSTGPKRLPRESTLFYGFVQ